MRLPFALAAALPLLLLGGCEPPADVSAPADPGKEREKAPPSPTGCGAPSALARRFDGCTLPEYVGELVPGEKDWMPAGFVLRAEGTRSCQIVLFTMTDCGPALTTFGTRSPFGDRWTLSTEGRYRTCNAGADGSNVCWHLPLATDLPVSTTMRLCAQKPETDCACDDVAFTAGPDGSILVDSVEPCAG